MPDEFHDAGGRGGFLGVLVSFGLAAHQEVRRVAQEQVRDFGFAISLRCAS
jgi:hypothetical protein